MATHLGKALLVVGLELQAYTLFSHQDTISKFNLNYERGLNKLPLGGDITGVLASKQTTVRLLIMGLYAISFLLIAARSKVIKCLVLLGVALNTAILANPYLDKSENAHFLFLQNLAIIGGLVYLLGEEGTRPTEQKNVKFPQTTAKKEESKSKKKKG